MMTAAAEGDIMKIVSKVGLALLVLVAVMSAAAGSAEHQGPRISVKDPRFDFGTVQQGTQPEHIFEIRNAGDEVLEIGQLQPT